MMVTVPGRKLVVSKRGYFAGVMFLILALFVAYEYQRAGKSPKDISATQAISLLSKQRGKHWVRMTGLQVDCSKPIQEVDNGKVTRTFYVAMDERKQDTFIVDTLGPCSGDPSFQYQGMLERDAGDYIRKEIVAAGVTLPGDGVPHLSVGDTPTSLLQVSGAFGVFGLMALGGTWWSRNRN